MISSIGASAGFQTRSQTPNLTNEQGSKLTETLSPYDAKSMSGTDAKAIGKAAAPEKSGGKGGPEGSRSPPPPQGEGGNAKGSVDSTAVLLLTEVIDSFGGADMTEDIWAKALASLTEQGVDLTKSIVDIRV